MKYQLVIFTKKKERVVKETQSVEKFRDYINDLDFKNAEVVHLKAFDVNGLKHISYCLSKHSLILEAIKILKQKPHEQYLN